MKIYWIAKEDIMTEWQTLSTKVAYENPYVYIEESKVINPAGQETVYGVLKSKADGVYIVPVDSDGNTYLTQQFRYPTQELSWECASGRVDEGDFVAAAKRELKEETGVIAGTLTELGIINPANGVAAFNEKVFLAEDLTVTDDELDPADGILGRKKIHLDETVDMIMNGEIRCPQTITAIFMAREYLLNRSR